MTTKPLRTAPHLVQSTSVRAMMLDVIVALVPTLCMSVFLFGWWVLVLCAISVGCCMAFEYAYRRFTHQSNTLGDLSACVTGLLLCLTLPSDSSWWVPVLGSAFAIVVVKQFYGGLGRNFMNPALAGRMLLASFPILMTSWEDPALRLSIQELDAVTAATPMSYLHSGSLPPQEISQLLLGHHGGSLGEVSAFMLLLGGLYLMGRRVISGRIPLTYLGTVAVLTFVFAPKGVDRVDWMLCQLLSGGLILGAFFLATDPTTSPVTPRGHVMFGVGCGVLTVVLRTCSSYPEGVGWAILTMNTCAWLLDKIGLPRRYGEPALSEPLNRLRQLKKSMLAVRIVKPDLDSFFSNDGRAPGEAWLDTIRAWGKNVLWVLGTVAAMAVLIFFGHRFTDLASVQAHTRAQQELLAHTMPKADFCSEAPYRVNGALSILAAFDEENHQLGYCVEVQAQGFGGPITMVVGVDLDGKVTGVSITDHKETLSVVDEALSSSFLRHYQGLSGTVRYSGRNSVAAVSGATATSRAITDGVNRALAIVASLGEEHMMEFEDSELG